MKKNLTLEALRGFSSLYVAIGHWALSYPDINSALKFLFSFGQEAVIIFFIVSGYVISISWSKNKNLEEYLIKRFRRIYFPFFVSILLSLIILPATLFSWNNLIGNLFMLQDFATAKPGVFVSGFMGNTPLWSLSYEWGFYLLFPFLFTQLKTNPHRITYISLLSLTSLFIYIIFPNHLLLIPTYLVIWWAGLELSKNENMALKNNNILFMLVPNIFVLSVLTILSYLNGNILRFGIYPVLFLRHFGFAFLFISLAMYGGRLKNILKKMLYPFLFIAPISYGIYIFHYPIFIQYSSGLDPFLDIPLKLFMLFLLSYVVEIKLQPLVNKVVKSTNRYSP